DKNRSNRLHPGEVEVSLTSTCASITPPKATITNPIRVSGGAVTATYEAKGCSGLDTITASLESGASASANLEVAPAELGAIEFYGASSSSLSIDGAGTPEAPSQTRVSFRVVNSHGDPVEGVSVAFSLDTDKTDQSEYDSNDQ